MMEKEEMVSEIKVKIVTKINVPSLAMTLLMLIFIVFAFSMPVLATEVVINDASACPCNITFTDITIKNVTNVGVIDLNLYYNPSVVRVTDVKDSEFDVTIPNRVKNSTGLVRIGAFQVEKAGLNGPSIVIANLTLKAVGDPGSTSPLNIVVNELKDATSQGNDIPYTITRGTFTVTPAIDNAPPVITITSPINGSTIGILNNSVIGCITDESELAVAKLTLNDEFVASLNEGWFNVKVNYRANETNRIEVFARDKEGNANSSQVLVNVLPNIVVVNKTTIANQTIEIKEAKNATNTAIELNATKAANVSVTINANTNASALNATPATNAYGLAENENSLGKYIDVDVTGIDEANLTFVSLYLYYTIADLDRNGDGDADDPGDLNETTLKVYWFSENTSLWMPLGPGADGEPDYTALGGPKVIDSERNKTEKYVKVTLNHFSTFALVAAGKIAAPVTPTPTPTPLLKGDRGIGGTFLPTPSPTSTLTPTQIPVEAPTPTLAPTVRPSVTPTQTHAPTIPTSPDVPFSAVKWLIIVIVASVIIITTIRNKKHKKQQEKR